MYRRDVVVDNVQALRGVAAFMVVIHHIRDYANSHIDGAVPTLMGAAGVDIFFVISGLVMMLAVADGSLTPGAFLKRRFIRIVPLYWIFSLLMLGLLAAGLHPVGVNGWSWSNVITSFLFLPQRRADGWSGPILPVGWTLNYEMYFYLVFAAGLAFMRGRRLALFIARFFGGLVTLGVLEKLITPEWRSFTFRFYTDPIVLEFVAGCMIGVVFSRDANWQTDDFRLRAIGIGLMGAGLLLLAMSAFSPAGVGPARAIIFGIPTTLIVAGAVSLDRGGLRLRGRWVMLGGAASYAVYLCHVFVLEMVEKLSARVLPQTPANVILTCLVGVVAVMGVGLAVHLYVETPLIQRLGSRFPPELRGASYTASAE